MPRFEPGPGEKFSLNGNTYQVMEHPSAPSLAYAQEGRKAVVYQVVDKDKKLFAWKVFKEAYRLPSLVSTCEILKTHIRPGLEVCDRICIDNKIAPDLIRKYRDLEYSILMPWIDGRTWFDLMYYRLPMSKQNSLVAARNVAQVLAELGKAGFAHCDIAGTNVIVNPKTGKISFIDVEDMFGPDLPRPDSCPMGTDGYRHLEIQSQRDGQWCADGDRFSTAILLGEILCWYNENFRDLRDGEHFFGSQEIQNPSSPRYKALTKALGEVSPELLELFAKAWLSKSLSECPKIDTWVSILESLTIGIWKPIDLPPIPLPFGEGNVRALRHHSENGLVLARPQIYPMESVRVNQNVTLRWTKVDGAHQYDLQFVEGDLAIQNGRFETIYHGPQTFLETSYKNYGIYYYRVRSLAESRTSSWSPIEGLYVFPLSKPIAPNISPIYNLLGDRSFYIRWSPVADAQWYEVEETTGSWPSKQTRNVVFDGSPHIVSTRVLIIGKKAGLYHYRVRAYNYCGYGEYSVSVSVEVKASLSPNAAQSLKINNPNGGTNYTISWESIPGASGYILFESRVPEIDLARRIYQGAAKKFVVTNKEPGIYYYTVAPHDAQGMYDMQLFSGWASTKVVLEAPIWHMSKQRYEVQDVDADNATIQLIWRPVKLAARYNLSWIDEMGKQHIEELKTNSCMIARPEGKYEFQVCAASESNVVGSWSTSIWVTVLRQQNSNYQIIIES